MHRSKSERGSTKQAVLEAALDVFAEHGYRDGSVAKICERAGANRAAVNYHFGSKENLYREVWRHGEEETRRAFPFEPRDGAVSPKLRLKWLMRSFLKSTFDPGTPGKFARIVAHELHEPHEFLTEDREALPEHLESVFRPIIRDLLGPLARDEDVTLCEVMVLLPMLSVGMSKFPTHPAGHRSFDLGVDPEEVAAQVFEFAMAGIGNLRRKTTSGSRV